MDKSRFSLAQTLASLIFPLLITGCLPSGIPFPSPPSHDEGEAQQESDYFYFSYDDSSSTASRDLSLFALSEGRLPSTSWARPYEFLNVEKFGHFNAKHVGPFEVSMGMIVTDTAEIPIKHEAITDVDAVYTLGVTVSGPTMNKEERENIVLTLLIDVSGSMGSKYATETVDGIVSLLDVTKHGLLFLPEALKEGDIINIVTFNGAASVKAEGLAYNATSYKSHINALALSGSTNLNAGIKLAYEVARRTYDANKSNRVVILTDAYANVGEVDSTVIAQSTLINGVEGIHFAGVGIGASFNDAFLNNLTDIGKGVYSAMITPEDGERIFTTGFIRFIDQAVANVRFKLEYPVFMKHIQSAAEESSKDPEEVQPINFSYNDEQFFIESFTAENAPSYMNTMTLEIEYDNEEGHPVVSELVVNIGDITNQGEAQIKSASIIVLLTQLIGGSMECETVINSGLYGQTISMLLFSDYVGYINKFCSLKI